MVTPFPDTALRLSDCLSHHPAVYTSAVLLQVEAPFVTGGAESLISPSNLKDIAAGPRVLGWQFSSQYSDCVSPSPPGSSVPAEPPAHGLMRVRLQISVPTSWLPLELFIIDFGPF